jgi:signal peptide peptidase SppA
VLEILQQPWAIQPPVLEGWCGLAEAKLKGDSPATDPVEAALKKDQGKEPKLKVVDGIALIPVEGSLVKRHFMFKCGSSFQEIREAVQAALDAPSVRAILLVIDSPGGTVDGTSECSHFLTQAGKQKPIYAYADGLMASAAYWLACSARMIAAPSTATVGSIGVVTVHYDRSQADEKFGIKRTFLTAGAYKAAGNDTAPLTEGDHAYIQGRLDHLYGIFLEHVAQGRGVSLKEAQAMADGKVFIGSQAQEAGLVDRIVSGLDEFIQLIKEDFLMDLKTLKAEHPEVYNQVVNEAKAGMVPQADVDQATAAAVKAEQERVLGLAKASMEPNQAEALEALAQSGATPEQAAAFKKAFGGAPAQSQDKAEEQGKGEDEAKEKILNALQDAAQAPLSPASDKSSDPGFDAMVKDHMRENQVSKGEAIRAVAKEHPEAHDAWLMAQQGKKG